MLITAAVMKKIFKDPVPWPSSEIFMPKIEVVKVKGMKTKASFDSLPTLTAISSHYFASLSCSFNRASCFDSL